MSGIINRAKSKSGDVGASAGLEFIEKKIWVTADSDTMTVPNCFSDEFDSYFVQIRITPSTSTHDVKMRWINDGSADGTSNYQHTFVGIDWDGTSYTFAGLNAAQNYLTPNCHNSTAWGCEASLWVYGARDTSRNIYAQGNVSFLHGTDHLVGGQWSGAWSGTAPGWEGITAYCSSTLRDGSHITVYGVRT